MRSHSSSIAWIICPADTESIEDANCRRFAPFSPAGAEEAREETNRSTCSCDSVGGFSICLAISCLTSICRFPLLSGYTLASTFHGTLTQHARTVNVFGGGFFAEEGRFRRSPAENAAGFRRADSC